MTMRRVLVVTADSLGESMAGPAIRAFELTKQISTVAEVKLVSTKAASITHPQFEIVFADSKLLKQHIAWAEIVVFQGALLTTDAWIARTEKIIVADLYDPMHLENLEQQKTLPKVLRLLQNLDINGIINRQILRADFFLCASDKQRDLWLGQLAALGRLNAQTYDDDSSLRRLIDVVPFGVQDEPPVQTERLIRDRINGISERDKVLVWGGGIYNWFDPLTLIRAIGKVAERRENLRLVFMGTKHPNPDVPEMQMLIQAQQLAAELKLLDRHVFFNEGWVPYAERANVLLDADAGVSTHLDHLETAFSFRTRILDYLWAGLPIIATRGDIFEEIIESNSLGTVVHPGDVEELATAIEDLLFNPDKLAETSKQVSDFASCFHWDTTAQPLLHFIQNASRAADADSTFSRSLNRIDRSSASRLSRRLHLYAASVREFGVGATLRSSLKSIRRRFTKR